LHGKYNAGKKAEDSRLYADYVGTRRLAWDDGMRKGEGERLKDCVFKISSEH
jgi:hypothetical protein